MKASSMALALGLTVTPLLNDSAAAQLGADKSECEDSQQMEFCHEFTSRQGQPLGVSIDCDTLGRERTLTVEFIRQFGLWGHIKNERDPATALRHVGLHGITPEHVKEAAVDCFENHRQP